MFEIDLYEEYICTKCNRCSELCNCNDNDKDVIENTLDYLSVDVDECGIVEAKIIEKDE